MTADSRVAFGEPGFAPVKAKFPLVSPGEVRSKELSLGFNVIY